MTTVLTSTKSFIEVQFPVSKVSKESYKERKSNYSQTLTALGKWWGRKPLILVRATIIGLLMPASDSPRKDREIFLKLLTMDELGLQQRKSKPIPVNILWEKLSVSERQHWFDSTSANSQPKLRNDITTQKRKELEAKVFSSLSYDEKLEYCDRPEHLQGPSDSAWSEINEHLKTNAHNLAELVEQLGKQQFGHAPRVGDAFCGGGSVPFEAGRVGCDVYASDLNPVAALMTWAGLHAIGGDERLAERIRTAQKSVMDSVDQQLIQLGIETRSDGWRADMFLFCTESRCPECQWKVPLAPSWVIGEKTFTVAELKPKAEDRSFDIEVRSGVSAAEMSAAKQAGTVKDGYLVCPNTGCKQKTPITMLRGDKRGATGTEYGLRLWDNEDLLPRPDDVFQERLYCIRWVEPNASKRAARREYKTVSADDIQRERKVLALIQGKLVAWQKAGILPVREIEPGDKTEEPIRTRGWKYWHQLFTPRQLLVNGLVSEHVLSYDDDPAVAAILLLGLGKCLDWNSKLCKWTPAPGSEKTEQTFLNQALNPLFNYGNRALSALRLNFEIDITPSPIHSDSQIAVCDARNVKQPCDVWITDPPYADAINYHELSEFFLAWYDKHLIRLFPDWYTDSKRALAVRGADEAFRKSMVDCYRNLANNMTNNGIQIVMFTHQDAGVWADLALILWASGLRVSAAWCIATETESALKEGNYVQGTVILVLRKQTSEETAFLDEIYPEVEREVKSQLDAMLALEDQEEPNFGDTDYQLAAYAAALRVLTKYKRIEDIDISYELSKPKQKGTTSPIENIIRDAVKVACDYLVPKGFDTFVWKTLTAEERFYLKGLDIESHGEYRAGAYQELARGFGVRDYRPLLSASKANQTRLKTATEFANKMLNDEGFGLSLVRNALFAIREVVRTNEAKNGRVWLATEVRDYWNQRKSIIQILRYLATMGLKLSHWKDDADAARVLAGAVENDHA